MELINQTFKKLSNSKSIEDLKNILDELNVESKYRMDDNTYPQLKFQITKEEIESLQKQNLLNEDNLITDIANESALTKLLYSLAWKNGDLKKIRHIIEGIASEDGHEKNKALVFYQFGKYLTKKPGEPIIDQHVLRAFGIYTALEKNDLGEIERFRKLSVITKKEKDLIAEYKGWLKNDLKSELRECEDYTYYVDRVLFAVGKKVKKRNKRS